MLVLRGFLLFVSSKITSERINCNLIVMHISFLLVTFATSFKTLIKILINKKVYGKKNAIFFFGDYAGNHCCC